MTTATSTRTERLADVLRERELDALLIGDLTNLRWLTGYTGSNGVAVVERDGALRFLTDFRYLTQAAQEVGEEWRAHSVIRDVVAGHVHGKGIDGYQEALAMLKEALS